MFKKNIALVLLFPLLLSLTACNSDNGVVQEGEKEEEQQPGQQQKQPKDTEKPFIKCLETINITIEASANSAVVTYTTPKGIDNISAITTQTAGLKSGESFPVGTTKNTFTAKDSNGNTATCSFDVVVSKKEEERPSANLPLLTDANTTPTGKTWQLVPEFSDEFDGPEIDEKWNLEPRGHTDLNWPGRVPALFQKKNFKIVNGEINIEVGKLPEPITISPYGKPLTYTYYGGIMRSRITTSVGNYYECRMKMNKTEMGGGFWLMGKNICGKKHEIDITESVGRITELTEQWARNWDQLYHSNAIQRKTKCNESIQHQKGRPLPVKNSEKYFVYGFWWKSPTELLFYVDGKYLYTINPPQPFDHEAFMQFSIESYDWNPIPDNVSKVENGSLEERTTYLDYIRTFKLVDK